MHLAAEAPRPHLFTVADYMKLEISGRTELLGGIIYDVSPKNERHVLAVTRLAKALNRGLGDEYAVRIQDPIAVTGWSGKNAPEIDIAIVAERSYRQTPTASDAFVFIEVSDTTYADDRATKIPLYVAAQVPTWHIDIPARQVEFYDVGADLAAPRVFLDGDTIVILGVPMLVALLFEGPHCDDRQSLR